MIREADFPNEKNAVEAAIRRSLAVRRWNSEAPAYRIQPSSRVWAKRLVEHLAEVCTSDEEGNTNFAGVFQGTRDTKLGTEVWQVRVDLSELPTDEDPA